MAFDREGGDTLESRLWEVIRARSLGMLSLTKSGLHSQPVVAFLERNRNRLWFVAQGDSEMVRSVGEGGSAMFVVQDGDMLASIGGAMRIVEDRRRIERLWNATARTWHPEGLHDPRLVVLCMDCVDAEVSISDVGVTRFAWELAGTFGRRPPVSVRGATPATLH
jgi:general stress protein 26